MLANRISDEEPDERQKHGPESQYCQQFFHAKEQPRLTLANALAAGKVAHRPAALYADCTSNPSTNPAVNSETFLYPLPCEDPGFTGFSGPPRLAGVPKILIADDNECLRQVISTALAAGHFDVSAVADGEQAWEALSHEHYDLLITDNDMPCLGGIELIERVRAAGMNLPVIITSGSLSVERVGNYLELQIAAVLPKPYGNAELLDVVRRILLPSARNRHANQESSQNAPLAGAAAPTKASEGVHNRILIADDDSLVRGSLAAVLESEGYVVDEAHNGSEAVSRALNHLPDLVLLDLNMPKLDGWTAFSKLETACPLVPVIVITARPHQYREAVRLGVDAFMEKPLNISILVHAIKNLTGEDENRHVRRITDPAFVTRLLSSADT
jgi:DNA-binding response OmpR family regulator